MNKLLTISIAAYNVEKYIEKAVLSCIDEKTAGKVEVLVIDDGSRDGTTDIVERLQDQYAGTVRVIKKENGGYGSTINLGVELANGYYFKQLDGDDWIDINGLEDLLNDLERYDVDMVLTPNIKCFKSGERDELRDNAPNMKRGNILLMM